MFARVLWPVSAYFHIQLCQTAVKGSDSADRQHQHLLDGGGGHPQWHRGEHAILVHCVPRNVDSACSVACIRKARQESLFLGLYQCYHADLLECYGLGVLRSHMHACQAAVTAQTGNISNCLMVAGGIRSVIYIEVRAQLHVPCIRERLTPCLVACI
jgi:hypothetical protein